RHQLAVRRDEVKFLAVGPPSRLRTASGGHLPFTARLRKRLHDDFELSRFVCLVCYPASVRRKLSVQFLEPRFCDHEGFPIFPCGGQGPQVTSGFLVGLSIQEEPTIL